MFDAGIQGRSWNLAAAMLTQFMGDWAKGEFFAANKVAGNDYICAPTAGSQAIKAEQ